MSSACDAALLVCAQVLSSFEIYKKEVLSGSLDWTPMHTSVRLCLLWILLLRSCCPPACRRTPASGVLL